MVILLSGLALGLASCGKNGRLPVCPTQGKAFVRGRPAAGAHVTFHPPGDAGPRPTARVDGDGSFRLSTYLSHDGAPPGRYAVTVVWPSPERRVDQESAGPDLLRGKYADPRTTPLAAEVQAGTNDLTPFELD
jgi:hypothetical protein